MEKTKFKFVRRGKKVEIPKRRSVAEDYKFFDPPGIVWKKINTAEWPYNTREDQLHLRDLAFMSLLYLSAARISELCRFLFQKGEEEPIRLPSVTKDQFVVIGDFLELRNLRVMKRQWIQVGGKWKRLEYPEEYPRREPISLPLAGGLSVFTEPIVEYLSILPRKRELFMFRRSRGYQIVNHCTGGEFPHYLREMGLKMWLRLFGKDLSLLQDFSGHKKIENLMHYLKEIQSEEVTSRILSVTFEDFEPKVMKE